MKTAINLLKLTAFILAVAWLCSCNNKQHIIKQIHDYQDSVGINKIRQNIVLRNIDSLQEATGLEYPPGIAHMLMAKIKLESQETMYRLTIDSLKLELE